MGPATYTEAFFDETGKGDGNYVDMEKEGVLTEEEKTLTAGVGTS